jgi:hypothetical protein
MVRSMLGCGNMKNCPEAGRIRRFAALPAIERRLLLRAAVVVGCARLAVWALPFRWICGWVRGPRAASRRIAELPVDRLAWAVQVAARRIPGASCLVQALALQWVLARAGQGAIIHVGVANHGADAFESHAWLEHCGKILVGGDGSPDRYAPILKLPADAR